MRILIICLMVQVVSSASPQVGAQQAPDPFPWSEAAKPGDLKIIIVGDIKFDQPIVGLICAADQLAATDSIVGLKGVNFPNNEGGFRGLEPHSREQVQKLPTTEKIGGGMSPDEVTLSQDMTTLGLRVNVTIQGVDQLRVLVLSKD